MSMSTGRTLVSRSRIGDQTYHIESVDAMGFDGHQGCLHIEFRVQDHTISYEDGAMYRYDALDVTQRRNA